MSVDVKVNAIKIVTSRIIPVLQRFVKRAFSDKFLLFTNVGLSTTLSGVGDIIEQNYEIFTHQINKWDKERTRNMSISGTAVGIVCHNWYKFLDSRLPGYTIRIVLKKIVVDQLIGSPLYITTFFSTLALVEGASKDEYIKEMKNKFWKLYAAEWMLWPPAQFINFYFLPTKYRVLFDNSVSLVYDVFTSHIKYEDAHKNDKEDS